MLGEMKERISKSVQNLPPPFSAESAAGAGVKGREGRRGYCFRGRLPHISGRLWYEPIQVLILTMTILGQPTAPIVGPLVGPSSHSPFLLVVGQTL